MPRPYRWGFNRNARLIEKNQFVSVPAAHGTEERYFENQYARIVVGPRSM